MATRNLAASAVGQASLEGTLFVYGQNGLLSPIEDTQRLLSYLPSYMQDGPILRQIFEMMGREMQRLGAAKSDIEMQLAVATATWGLSWWEQMVGIAVQQDNDDYVTRRALVVAALAGSGEESEFYFVQRIASVVAVEIGAEADVTVQLLDPVTNPYEMTISVPATLTEGDPSTAPVAVEADANPSPAITAGEYTYKVTFVFASGETIEGDSQSNALTVTGATSGIDLSDIPVSQSAECLGRRIYRKRTADGPTYYKVGEISNNYTTTYDDSMAQSVAVSNNVVLPTTNTAGTLLEQRLQALIRATKPAHIKHTLQGTAFQTDISVLDGDPL